MHSKYKLGEIFNIHGYPKSEVVGIDHYKMTTLSGKSKAWFSYTLVSKSDSDPLRWWASEGDGGLYCWEPIKPEEVTGELDLDQSGLSVLQATGDTIVSSPYSASTFYRGNDGTVYCQEAFENEVLYMKATLMPHPG